MSDPHLGKAMNEYKWGKKDKNTAIKHLIILTSDGFVDIVEYPDNWVGCQSCKNPY